MAGTRERMVGAAAELFRERGYDGTGFRDVVGRAGAARGAIYHHFPGGKVELGESAARLVGDRLTGALATRPGGSVLEVVTALSELAETALVRGERVPGCPVAAVALSADDPDGRLRAAADGVFRQWQAPVAAALRREGASAAQARATATLVVAALEGAVVLCRAAGSARPLQDVRRALLATLAA